MLLFTALSQIMVSMFIRCRKTEKPNIPRRKEIQRRPGKVSCKRAKITMRPGKWQVDVTQQTSRGKELLAEQLKSWKTWNKCHHRTGECNVSTGQNGVGEDPALKLAVVTERLKPSVVHVLSKCKICLLIFFGQQMLRPRVRQPWRHYPGSFSLACAHSTVFQFPSLGTAMTFKCKPTGKEFGEKHRNDMEPEGSVWEKRLKELRPWILLVALQGCPGCERTTAALGAVLG